MVTEKNPTQGDVRAAMEVVQALAEPEYIVLGDDPGASPDLVVLPGSAGGKAVVDLKPFRDARLDRPERRTGTARLTTLDSFVEHVKRFADPDTAIFAIDNPKAPKLLAVFDYHEAHNRPGGEENAADEWTPRVVNQGRPRFGVHRAEYAFPVSDEWKAWTGIQGKALSQADLASFLEDHLLDVRGLGDLGKSAPEAARQLGIKLAGPAELLTVAKGLQIEVGRKVTNAANLSSGETELHFEERHAGKGGTTLSVPSGFGIGIPVFRGGEHYVILARLRYRVVEASITWTLQLHRTDAVFDDAFQMACAKAQEGTTLPLFFGTPEGVS